MKPPHPQVDPQVSSWGVPWWAPGCALRPRYTPNFFHFQEHIPGEWYANPEGRYQEMIVRVAEENHKFREGYRYGITFPVGGNGV